MMRKLQSFNDTTIPEDATLASLASPRMQVVKECMGKMGAEVNIEPPFFMIWGCNIFLGDRVYMNRG